MAQQPKKADASPPAAPVQQPGVLLRLLCNVHHDQAVFAEGAVAEFPADAAERLIASGAAEIASAEPAEG